MKLTAAQLKAETEKIRLAVDKFNRDYFEEPFRNHLGASEIGNPCWRALWYGFRWVAKMQFTTTFDRDGMVTETSEEKKARMARLFQRGHAEEERLISYLRGAGLEVSERDESGSQYRVIDHEKCGGHFGGSLDGLVRWPGKVWMLGEFKTHNDKSYIKLKKDGVELSKPMHVKQTNVYGYKKKIDQAVYLPLNKNDDSISELRVRNIDHADGAASVDKASQIIRSQLPLARLHRDPSAFECKWCDYSKICHEHAGPSERNCRSCKHAEPRPEKLWFCGRAGQAIPADVIPKGCPQYYPVETQ